VGYNGVVVRTPPHGTGNEYRPKCGDALRLQYDPLPTWVL